MKTGVSDIERASVTPKRVCLSRGEYYAGEMARAKIQIRQSRSELREKESQAARRTYQKALVSPSDPKSGAFRLSHSASTLHSDYPALAFQVHINDSSPYLILSSLCLLVRDPNISFPL